MSSSFVLQKKWIEVSFVQDFLDVQPEIHHLVAMHGENIFLHCLFCDEQVQKKSLCILRMNLNVLEKLENQKNC